MIKISTAAVLDGLQLCWKTDFFLKELEFAFSFGSASSSFLRFSVFEIQRKKLSQIYALKERLMKGSQRLSLEEEVGGGSAGVNGSWFHSFSKVVTIISYHFYYKFHFQL